MSKLASIARAHAQATEFGAHLAPRLRVGLGESFVMETNDALHNTVRADGDVPRADADPIRARQFPRFNPLAGPVFVEGVEAGDTLVVEIEEIAVRSWGFTGTMAGHGLLAGLAEFPELDVDFATILQHEPGPSGTLRDGDVVMRLDREARWPLAPFVGTIATAPERDVENSLIGQGPWGGNVDCRDVTTGSRIYLNAAHPGGLLFLGDVHASQGDAELSGIADETAADVTVRCDVLRGRSVPGVLRIDTADALIQVESARNAGSIEAALRASFVNMIRWLRDDYGMAVRESYLHMSANSGVRINVYQFTLGCFACGVAFPKASL